MLNERLLRAVGQLNAEQPPLHFVQCSSSLPTGAIILHGFAAGEESARVVVKTARNPELPHSLQREWESLAAVRCGAALARLTPEGMATFDVDGARLTPEGMATFDVDGARFFAYSGLPGRTMSAAFRNRIWRPRATLLKRFAARALQVALLVHRPASKPAPAALIAEDLLQELEGLRRTVPQLPQTVTRRATAAAATIAAAPGSLPCGRVHGDFSPHNLMIESSTGCGSTRIIDWEHMEDDRPQHLDIFRFLASSLLMGMRGPERRHAQRSMLRDATPLLDELLYPWLGAMGANAGDWARPDRLEALWWHYWIHATRREFERHATTDPGDSALLQRLAELTE